MSTMHKYRINDLSKDFKIPNKSVIEILTKYAEAPKNHMHVLSVKELDIIFAHLTASNQIASIEEIFAEIPPVPATPKTADKPAAKQGADKASQAAASNKNKKKGKPAQPQKGTAAAPSAPPRPDQPRLPKQEKPDKPFVPRPVAEKRVIDTSGATINIDKYDERIDRLVPERAENMKRGKEKFQKRGERRDRNPAAGAKRRTEERDRLQRLQLEIAKKAPLKVSIPDQISVGELATRMKKTGAEVVRQLFKLGVMASVSEFIDYETAALVAIELGCTVEREIVVTIEDRLIDLSEDAAEDLAPRAPVVVVMGHVDHGKTSLLDKIREANVASGEAGGITQHIGAYRVFAGERPVTFLDTPGHEAFTAMRARGAKITDVAILVVAANDGIMPQTIESINHARAADIPIVVAINKIDLPDVNPDKIKQQLTEHNLVSEEWGGDTIVCHVSAKTGEGIENLLEMVVLTADMAELKANPNRLARGTIIEARLDKGRGPIVTALVQNGTLKQGDAIIAGTAVGRVRVMTDERGSRVTEAAPSVPVEITGMGEVPEAGELFNAVSDERMARELADQRRAERKDAGTKDVRVSLDTIFSRVKQGEIRDLNIIVKADVQGSAEAIRASLEKLTNEEVRVRVIHSAAGAITESDIMLAAATGAVIVGFNVRPDNAARDSANRAGVDIRLYSIIYDCIQEIEAAIKGMQAPKFHEVEYGKAEVRQLYKVSKTTICGCLVQSGRIVRGCDIRVVRDGVVIHTGPLASLRRFKDDVREVGTNYECGMQLEKFNDVREGDILEAFGTEEIKA